VIEIGIREQGTLISERPPNPAALPKLLFDEAAARAASDAWGLNCGPAAIAAICGYSLEGVRPFLGDFEQKRYTNPSLMFNVLERMGVKFRVRSRASNVPRLDWPVFGLARVQWEGPWMDAGVPIAARYRKTHWVGAAFIDQRKQWIFDVNCLSVGGWVPSGEWEYSVAPWIVRTCVPRGDGRWHLTHVIELKR
jgi:hypothetical protein